MLQPHSGSCLVNAQRKLEDLAIKISMDFHCQPWTLSLIGIIAVLFATGLASVTPQDWDLGQKLQLAVCYLTAVGSLLLDVSYDQFSLLTKLLHSITDRLSCYHGDSPKMGRIPFASVQLSVMCRLLCSLLVSLAVTGGAVPYPSCTCQQTRPAGVTSGPTFMPSLFSCSMVFDNLKNLFFF